MTNQRIERLIQESEKMLARMEKAPQLKQIYKDVNFRRVIEDGKAELLFRETDFRELTPDELGYAENIFA